MSEITKCNRGCGSTIEFRKNEMKGKKLPWDIAKNDWHTCPPQPTIVNLKPVMWFCWECGMERNIAGNPCAHFMKMSVTERFNIMEKHKR